MKILKKELIFTDRNNFSHGGEIPKLLGTALCSDPQAFSDFTGYTSAEKKSYISNSKKLKTMPEIKNYVETKGESIYSDTENKIDLS